MKAGLLACALAAALPPAPVVAAGWGEACAHRVALDPPEITLGDGRRARVVLDLADDDAPIVRASAGRIEALRQVARRRFEAVLVPPDHTVPQVSIVTVWTSQGCGWAALRLFGQGDAEVRSTPGARIEVRIGDREFGPARADASGRALLPVVVPPGVRFAHHGKKAIDLKIPATRHVAVLLERPAVRADEGAEVALRVLATDAEGRPWRGAPVELRASAGVVTPPRLVAPGEFAARWSVDAGASGSDAVSARLAGEELGGSAHLARPAGPPARIHVDPDPPELRPGDRELTVRVAVADAAGNPVDADVRLAADPGAPGPAVQGPPGQSRFEVGLPADLGGRDRVRLEATLGDLSSSAAVALRPGPAARVAVAPPAGPVRADGEATASLRVAILDRRGVLVASPPPVVAAALGAIGAPSLEADGWYAVAYRAPALQADADEEISASAGDLRASTRFPLAGRLAALELAPRVGVLVTSGGTSLQPALGLAAWPRAFGARVGLALDLAWTRRQERGTFTAGSSSIALEGRSEYLVLLAGPAWRRPTGPRSALWVSAGAGAARASSSVAVTGSPTSSEATWVPAAGGAVGWGIRAGRGFPFAEVGVRWQGDPHLDGLAGSFVPFTFSLGYRLEAL